MVKKKNIYVEKKLKKRKIDRVNEITEEEKIRKKKLIYVKKKKNRYTYQIKKYIKEIINEEKKLLKEKVKKKERKKKQSTLQATEGKKEKINESSQSFPLFYCLCVWL